MWVPLLAAGGDFSLESRRIASASAFRLASLSQIVSSLSSILELQLNQD